MKDLILAEVEKIRRKYSESAEEIVSGYNREQDLSKDYEGRQIFELLQNADDESEDGKGNVRIEFDGKILSVSNTGKPFSFAGVKSLLYPNASPKRKNAEKIGCKGLGFRSILTWAKKVIVASKDFSIEFSQENAKEFLKQIKQQNPALEADIKELSNDEFPIATLTCPRILEKNFLENDFATTIRIDCREEMAGKIENQILGLEFEELVFLPTLKEIEIKTQNCHKKFVKVEEETEQNPRKVFVESTDLITDKTDFVEWLVFREVGEIQSKKYEFIIAYDPKQKRKGNVLYSYFKTDVKMSFPALIHGTFELTSDRNGLQKESNLNKALFPLLCDFIVDTAVKISDLRECCDYGPLKLAISSDVDDVLKNNYNVVSTLKEKIKEKKVFPSIQNKYISLSDNPKYSKYTFDELLNPEKFGNLLKGTKDSEIADYLTKDLHLDFYPYITFADFIDNDIDYYSSEQKVNLVDFTKRQYGTNINSYSPMHLLEDNEGFNIVNGATVYPLPGDGEVIDIPKWVKVKFLNPHQEKLFYEKQLAANKRDLVNQLSFYNVEEYSFEKLLRSILGQFDSQIDTQEKCVDILKWLWGYFKSPTHQQISDVRVKVICRDGSIKYADQCYMGAEFENSVGEKIVSSFSENFVSDDLEFIKNELLEEKKGFFLWLGVSLYPRFISYLVPREEKKYYLDYLYPIWDQHDKMYLTEKNFYSDRVTKIQVGTFEHLDKILDRVDFNDTLAWMLLDDSLKKCIYSENETKRTSVVEGIPVDKVNTRTMGCSVLKSYLRYYLRNTEWIVSAAGEKKKPQYCCFSDDALSPLVIVPKIDYSYIKRVVGRDCKKEIITLLNALGVSDNLYEIDKDIVYEILLQLPEIDKSCKIGRSIYRKILLRENDEELISDNPKYQLFLERGKVLVKCNGQKSYVPISSAFYADKKVSSEEILKQFNMLEVDARKGTEKVRRIFGVNPLKNLNVELACEPELHEYDGKFKKYYKNFLPYVYACRLISADSKKDLGPLKKTEIHICRSVRLKYSYADRQTENELDNFEREYIREKNVAYIRVKEDFISFEKLIRIQEFDDAVAEIISAIIDVNDEKDVYQLLFKENDIYREKWMRSSRGDEDLEFLNMARKAFNYDLNYRDSFWRNVYESVGNTIVEEITTDEIIRKLDVGDIDETGVDYEKINESAIFLIKLFQKLQIDIDDYNRIASVNIDISKYWIDQLYEKIESYRPRYLAFVFEKLRNDEQCVEKFEELKIKYGSFENDTLNTVNFDINHYYQSLYEVSFETLDNIEDADIIEAELEKNKAKNAEKIIELSKSTSDELMNTYLLFNKLEQLEKRQNNSETESIEDNREEDIRRDTDAILTEIRDSSGGDVDFVNIKAVPSKNTGSHGRGKPKRRRVHSVLSDFVKQQDGLIGEAKAYYVLKKKFPGNVDWVSGNAEKAKVVAKGDDTLGYDLKYRDQSKKTHYVEVKASRNSDVIFSLTNNELAFANAHASNYEIIFVLLDDKGKPIGNPKNLGNLFHFKDGEDLLNNEKFSIENKEFTIYAKIADENN